MLKQLPASQIPDTPGGLSRRRNPVPLKTATVGAVIVAPYPRGASPDVVPEGEMVRTLTQRSHKNRTGWHRIIMQGLRVG